MKLRYESVDFAYRRRKPVLQDFTWQIPGGRTVLLGPNGAGKSTVLALGAAALRPQAGRMVFDGSGCERGSVERHIARHVGWMPQQIRPVPRLRVREQVAYAGWLKGLDKGRAWHAAGEALDRVGLADRMGERTSELSGGQLRRVGLAQVLVHGPSVLLLDEPTSGLDPDQRARFRKILSRIPVPVVVSTHQTDDVSDLYDEVAVIRSGRLLFQGSVAEFLDASTAADGVAARRAEAAYASIVGSEE